MKITEIIPHVIKPGLDGDTDDQSAWAFIEMRTDEGITGWGEATKYGRGGSFLLAHAINMVKEDFIGEDPANIKVLWHKLYRRFTYTGARGLPTTLVAGFDMALWDIKGKATGRPVFDLLGGKFCNPVGSPTAGSGAHERRTSTRRRRRRWSPSATRRQSTTRSRRCSPSTRCTRTARYRTRESSSGVGLQQSGTVSVIERSGCCELFPESLVR